MLLPLKPTAFVDFGVVIGLKLVSDMHLTVDEWEADGLHCQRSMQDWNCDCVYTNVLSSVCILCGTYLRINH